MKNIFIMLLAMFSCVPSAYAQSFTVDGLSYNVTKASDEESPGEVEVTGGEIKEVIEFPETVTYEEVTYTVTSIGSNAFSGRTNSSSYTRKYIIPGTVRSIKESAFYDNYHLEEVELNEGLQTIGRAAFGYNYPLKEIRIPSTVTSIDQSAFITNQQNRATISCLAATPPALLGTETFKGRTDATLHVMKSDVEAYQEAEYWKDFSEIAGDKLYRYRCYSPVITCDDDLLTMSCKTEGATIYYTTDGSVPDENAIRYTSPISYTTNQIICAIAIAEGCENSRICSFYDKESLENVTDEQGVSYTLRQDSDGSYYYSVTGHSDELEAEIVIPDDLGGYPVRSIEYYALGDCASLTSITIPNGVTSIGANAFTDCGLTSITIPGSVTSIGDFAFRNCPVKDVKCVIMDYSEFCNNLVGGVFNAPIQLIDNEGNEITEYIIPEGVTSIGHDAFKNCTSLTSITIPGSVTSIGSYALWNCSSLRMVISKISTPFDISAFNDVSTNQATLIVPKDSRDNYMNVTGWNFAFIFEEGAILDREKTDEQGVSYMLRQDSDGSYYYSVTGHTDELNTEIVIPADFDGVPVRRIEKSAFDSCIGLTSITIPNSVASIGEYAFRGCTSLSSITIPNSVTSIEKFAFAHCTGLTAAIIGNGIMSLKGGTFYGCSGLTSVILGNSVTKIEDAEKLYHDTNNTGIISNYGVFGDCSGLTSITIPEGVTSIGEYAFYECSSLSSVTFPSSLISIKNSAFWGTSVKDVKCVIMDYSEFCNNPVWGVFNVPIQLIDNEGNEITEYIIPEGVTSIGINAFRNCESLESITIPNSVTSIGSYALMDCSSLRMVISKISTPFDIFAFNNVSTNQAILVVPKDSRDDYKNVSGWGLPFIYEEGETIYDKEQTDEQGVKYTLRQDEDGSKYYSVTGYTDELSAEVEIPTDLGGCPVRNIGESAFSGCTNLESITIPNSVTSIGNGTFKGCEILSSINIPNSVTSIGNEVFSGCTYLESITIPNSVTSIGNGAFADCEYLSSISIPSSVTSIGNEVFSGCTYLESITIPNSVTSIGDGAFRGCEALLSIVIRNSTISIGSGAFQGCVKLESFTLPSKMTTISNYAFSGCKALSTVKMGKNISSIGEYAFNGCSSLTSITLPDELESIGAGAFQNCALVSINIPESVTTIGASAFSNLPITSITIPYSVETIGSNAFSNNDNLTTIILEDGITEIVDGMFSGCGKLSFVSIPDGVDAIGNYAFQNCRSLTSIKLPETLTSMGSGVFNGSGLKFIELPNSFTDIPAGLFRNNSFQYIKLGSNVKRIGENAFGGNSALVIEIDMVTPPTIKSNVFPDRVEGDGDFAKITVIVPSANAETIYRKKAVWKSMTYANQGNMAEVTINTPGELSSEIYSQIGITAPTVVSLKVNGVINATDFTQILTNMKSLLRLDLSDCDITEIPDNALSGKTMLKELILPSKLQVIGKNAFKDCPYLTGNLDLPITLTSIGEYAFVGTKYTSVTLPSSLKTIGDYAFQNLPIEQELTLPKVTSVGAHAFEGTNITGVTIPDGVTTIGDRAFANTPTEGHVTIPDGVTHLGNEVFSNTKISTVFLPNSVTMLSQGLFQGCKNLNLVYVPDNYTGMGNYAFDGCEALTTVRLSANTTTMGEYSMQGTPMKYVKVPSKVEVLSRGAFKNSKNLVSLALPASLKSVEAEALYGCTALRNLSVEAIEPPTIKGGSAIQGIHTDLCIISIPTQSFNAYMNAPHWGLFVQMRNDIAVETAGNGEITFESVEEEEEEEDEEEVVYAKRRGTAQAKKRAPSLATPEDAPTYANNGSSIFVPENGKVLLRITPNAGEELVSATLDGKDITPDIKDNVYIATADKANAKLVVKFSGAKTQQGDMNGDGSVNVVDVLSVANIILNGAYSSAADMNGDGSVNVVDVLSVANIILNGGSAADVKLRMPFELDPQ